VGAAAGGIPDLIADGETGFLVPPGDTDAFCEKLQALSVPSARKKMGIAARREAERWGWEAATSHLRNVQYEKALVNFHSRAFGGLGRPRSGTMWRLLGWRIGRVLQNLGATVRTRIGFATAWKRVVRWRLRRRQGKAAA